MRLVRAASIPLLVVLTSAVVPREAAPADAAPFGRFVASVEPVPAAIRSWMTGSSWRPGCPVGLDQLRLVRLTYWGFDHASHRGRLVVATTAAQKIVRAFRALYRARFPIRQMRLVDAFGASDKASMRADNTSAFNCRYRNGICCTWSMHAFGKAIDIDPVENPELWSGGISPPNGRPFIDRSVRRRGMIFHGDAVWRAFRAVGWRWGGDWTSTIDYQHFSSNGR
ncbi:MAG TPA: M15 family metallopeptidase [Actinomycetota bacterium]|nr:M15 family metallopeptidase [Actinomycetota bacterium]